MPAVRNEAFINPRLLLWARESAGFDLAEAAKKVPIKPEKLMACEQGLERLTIAQLRKISNAYKRPLAFFYLPVPPETEPILHDFRQLPDETKASATPALRLEIRKAKFRREAALEMYKELEADVPAFQAVASIEESALQVGQRLREYLNASREKQASLLGDYASFGYWRDLVEASGVLVFQASVEMKQMRGVSIGEFPLPIILINRKDHPKARTFTLLHECAHLMLRSTGLCDLADNNNNSMEVFCNAVAGEALVPMDWLKQHPAVSQSKINDSSIKSLADSFGVSREVVLRRLLTLNVINQSLYQQKTEQLRREYVALLKANSEANKKQGFAPPDIMAISGAGKTFIRLVLDSYRQRRIGLMDVSEYLGVKLKHLDKLEHAVFHPTA